MEPASLVLFLYTLPSPRPHSSRTELPTTDWGGMAASLGEGSMILSALPSVREHQQPNMPSRGFLQVDIAGFMKMVAVWLGE